MLTSVTILCYVKSLVCPWPLIGNLLYRPPIAAVKLILLLLLLFISALPGQAQEVDADSAFFRPNQVHPVSLVQLLANPDQYHGKRVRVTGFLHSKFEDSALYLSKADGDHLVGSNGFWIEYADDVRFMPTTQSRSDSINSVYFDGKYVTADGVFNKDTRGHLSSFAGTIEEVDRVVENRRWYNGSEELWRQDTEGQFHRRTQN